LQHCVAIAGGVAMRVSQIFIFKYKLYCYSYLFKK